MLQSSLPPSRRSGGVGYQVDLLAAELTRRGNEVTVFVADDSPGERPYQCVQIPGGGGRAFRVLGVGWHFARLDLSRFDVVHAHGDDWLFGRRPRVRTFYGTALMEARTATDQLRRASQLCYYGLEWVSSLNPRSVTISDRTRRYLPLIRQSIPCAFDPAVFFPGGDRTPRASILFVAGSLQGRKRGHLLLDAFAAVRNKVPEATLTIVSRDVVTQRGVTCLSNVPADRLADLYRSHWVLCSTSAYEGFGVPYVEALASGLPIVVTSNDGAREVLGDGKLGVVCAPDDLASELIALIEDDARRVSLSSGGVVSAHQYSITAVADRYEAIYRDVFSGTTRAPLKSSGRRSRVRSNLPGRELRVSSHPSSSHGRGATA